MRHPQLGVLDNGHTFSINFGRNYIPRWRPTDLPKVFDNSTSFFNTSYLHHLLFFDATQYENDFWFSNYRMYWGYIHSEDHLLSAAANHMCTRYASDRLPSEPSLEMVFFLQIRHLLSAPETFDEEQQGVLYWMHWCRESDDPPSAAEDMIRSLHSLGIMNTNATEFGFEWP